MYAGELFQKTSGSVYSIFQLKRDKTIEFQFLFAS